MHKKRLLFIVNPRSGRGQIKNRLLDILDIFIKADYDLSVYITQEAGDARLRVIHYGEKADMIVCSGGDGTLNEVASGVMELKKRPVIGFIPAGSTNDFASSLGVSKNMLTAARHIITGSPYAIDIGRFCDNRYFVYIAAFGAFTEVSYLTPQEQKNMLGHQAYILAGVKSITAMKTYHMKITCSEATLQGEFIFGMITNTISVGGFKGLVSPDVALDDGEFEVLLIRAPKTPMDLSNILSYMFLKEEENEYVHKFRTNSISIESEESTDWVLDGEFGGSRTEVHVDNMPKSIEIQRNISKGRY